MAEKNAKSTSAGHAHAHDEEAQLERLGYEFSFLQQQAGQLQQQLGQIQALNAENEAAIGALSALKQTGDTMMPIGSGVFFKVKVSDNEKVFAEVGSRVIAERSASDVSKLLTEKKGQLEKALKEIQDNLNAISRRMSELQQKAAELEERAKAGGSCGNPNCGHKH